MANDILNDLNKIEKDILSKLNKIQQDIRNAENAKSRAEGKLESGMLRLKTEFNIDSYNAAVDELQRIEQEIETLESDIKKRFKELMDQYYEKDA